MPERSTSSGVLAGQGGISGDLAGRLGGAQGEQLAGVVPFVDGLGDVDALVALQPDQLTTGPRCEDAGYLGLAHPCIALEQQRPVQHQGQEDRGGQPLVGEVAMVSQRVGDVLDGQVDGRAS